MSISKNPMSGPPATPQERKSKKKRRNNIIVLVVGLTLIIGFGSYKLYFQERWAADEAIGSEYTWDQEDYFYRYPDGKYTEEVNVTFEQNIFNETLENYKDIDRASAWDEYFEKFDSGKNYAEARSIYERGSFLDLKYDVNRWFAGTENLKSPLSQVNTFTSEFPESKYKPAADSLYGIIWDRLNESFAKVSRRKVDKNGGIAFFKACMQYLEEEKKDTIFFHFTNWDVQLKDWEDYTESAKEYLDELTVLLNSSSQDVFSANYDPFGVKSPPPSGDSPPSAKTYLQGEARTSNKNSFVKELKNDFQSIFGNAPFTIAIADENASMKDNITFNVDTRIGNQEFKMEGQTIPELYTITTSEDFLTKTFDGYIFGIESDCSVQGRIPGQDISFQGKFIGDPAGSFSQISGISDAYTKLVGSIFESMGKSVGEQLGFPSSL